MAYFIDQSGKIEDTSKDTIVAMANGSQHSVRLSARTKRKIQEIFRKQGRRKQFIYITFSALILALLENSNANTVYVDDEYPGHGEYICSNIKRYSNIQAYVIQVGKSSNCYKLAYKTYKGKLEPDINLTENEIMKIIKRLVNI